MDWKEFQSKSDQLTKDIGLDSELFYEVVLWALIEERIELLTPNREEMNAMFGRPDCLDKYWKFVESKTKRPWKYEDIKSYWDRAVKSHSSHVRKRMKLEDKLRLFFTSPRECRYCHRGPPKVKLHIDHKEPVSKGGGSRYWNLQFLCEEHNLSKGPKLRREDFFDKYLC